MSRDRNLIFVMQYCIDLNDILNIIKCVFETCFVLEKFSVKHMIPNFFLPSIYKMIFINLLLQNNLAQMLEMRYVALLSDPLPSLFSGSKMSPSLEGPRLEP